MNAIPMVLITMLGFLAQGPPPFKPSTNPLSDALRNSLASASKNLVGSAELMPAEKYSFHPTPATAASYLRLNDILPPSAQPKK